MNKKTQLNLTPGLVIRFIAMFIDVISLPFLVVSPSNVYAQVSFGFGNFLLLLGGLTN